MRKLLEISIRVTALLMLACFPFGRVEAQEAEPRHGVFCDTPEQVECFVELGTKLGSANEGYVAVNAKIEPETGNETQATTPRHVGHGMTTTRRPKMPPAMSRAIETPHGHQVWRDFWVPRRCLRSSEPR